MKKTVHILLLLVVIGSYWLSTPSQGQAWSSHAPVLQEADFTPLSAIGIVDELLLGPYANYDVRFGVPASWKLEAGSSVLLNLEVSSTLLQGTTVAEDDDFTGATLEIYFNDVSLGVIALKKGAQTLELAIPSNALVSPRLDGRHELFLFLDASIDCVYPHETSLLVRASSGFYLPHSINEPALNLSNLPRPIYQIDSIQPEPLVLVLPDQPAPQELQAALTVSAGFGRLTSGLQALSIQSESALTEVQKATSHLIFIGKAGSFSTLETVEFPVDITTSEIAIENIGVSDGIMQMAVSPWNPALSVMFVGGGDAAAVVKSAQALSSGQIRVGSRPDLTVVTSVADAVDVPSVATDRTLESLGYDSLTGTGAGFQTLEYGFYVPFGQVAGENPFFDLMYSHSALLDFQSSGAIITVNDQIIGSLRFTDETAASITTAHISIPAYVIHPGFNTLSVEVEFVPLDYCSDISRNGLWLTVHKTSLLHLPLISAPLSAVAPVRDLNQYPGLFTLDPSLGNLAFVVPTDDSVSWNIAAQLTSFLGKDATGLALNPAVAFGDAIPDEIRKTRDLIVVGRATQLPIIADLGESLPSPFNDGSDLAIERGLQFSYLIPEGTNLGYLQLLPAPWDANRTILTVMGSTQTGLEWSGNALINQDLISQLGGTFAVVTDLQILTADTRIGLGTQNLSATAVPGEYQTVNNQPQDSTQPQHPVLGQEFLIVAIWAVSIATVLFLAFLVLRSRKQKSS